MSIVRYFSPIKLLKIKLIWIMWFIVPREVVLMSNGYHISSFIFIFLFLSPEIIGVWMYMKPFQKTNANGVGHCSTHYITTCLSFPTIQNYKYVYYCILQTICFPSLLISQHLLFVVKFGTQQREYYPSIKQISWRYADFTHYKFVTILLENFMCIYYIYIVCLHVLWADQNYGTLFRFC